MKRKRRIRAAGMKSASARKRVRQRSHVPVKVGMTAEPTYESLCRLRNELQPIVDTHPELFWQIYQLIGWLCLPDGFIWQQQTNRDQIRHELARLYLERGEGWDRNAGSAFRRAARDLARRHRITRPDGSETVGSEHPAAASSDRIEKIYKTGERKLPRELRRVPPRRRRDRVD
ncbi:MAG: hypothetical protein ACLQF4_11290 [Xanthobacteraceae bacterium]